MKEERTLDLSWKTIFRICAFLFLLYLLYLVKDILVLILFAFILSFLVEPAISFLEEKRISRPISVLFIYLFLFSFLGILIFFLVSQFFQSLKAD
jgi:Domain of unknown function DUF20.